MSDLAYERLQVLDFEQSIYKPERRFHEIGALEHGYVGIIVGCTVQRIRSFWRFEGRERAGLRFWEGHLFQIHSVPSAAVADPAPLAGLLDEDAPHRVGRGCEEMSPVLPVGSLALY